MLYLVTQSFYTASWIYFGRREEGGELLQSSSRKVEVPTAAALFPGKFLRWPPLPYAEKVYNLVQWNTMPRGGHFAFAEEPEVAHCDIVSFARLLLNS